MKAVCAFLLFLFALSCSLPLDGLNGEFLEAEINREIDVYINTGKVGMLLKELAEAIDFKGMLTAAGPQESWKEPKISLFCTTCAAGVNRILAANTTEEIFNLAIGLCLDLGLGNQVFCEGVVTMSEATVIWLVENTEDETGNDICGVIFVGRGCVTRAAKREWSVTLPAVTKPPVSEPSYPQNPPSTLKILHLADTHYDPKYLPGSNAVCDEIYFCCNAESGAVQNPEDAAGYWGDYRNCDLPLWTLEVLYQSISDTHPDIDYIIWTGDLVPHIVWDTSKEGNLDIINEMAKQIRNYFPGIPVFPAVGNHEAVPLNIFSQPYVTDPELSMSWLYVDLANLWSFWLPPDTVQNILYSAYYSTQVTTGLKLVSLNTNWCYSNNWFLIYDSTDIANELDFLAKELQASEDIGESVYIIGHHPPGYSDCQLTWSREFNRVASRYEDTITGMFFGHTHKDHFELFFDPDNATRVYDIAYIGQSQTTYSDLNPGYKVYTVEGNFQGSKYRVLDHENYIMDLDLANQSNVTNFFRLYKASEEYGMTDLSPQSWLDLINQMIVPNSTVFDTFYRNYVKNGTPRIEKGCSDSCKDNILCRMLISDNSDHTQCQAAGLE